MTSSNEIAAATKRYRESDQVGFRALRENGFNGPLRPDHVPQLVGEENGEPGYTMLGRLFAFGYIRGLIHATEPRMDS